jgi:hypothetical protein
MRGEECDAGDRIPCVVSGRQIRDDNLLTASETSTTALASVETLPAN